MDLLHLMATTHPTRVMEATVGSRMLRRRAPVGRPRTDASTVGSRMRTALTARVVPAAPKASACTTC